MLADLPDLIARRSELTGDSVALEELATGRSLTYAELDERSARAASLFEALGVGEGDRVAILCRNRLAFFEALFACARLGAILVPLNWRMPPAELDPLLAHCGPRLLLHGGEDRAIVRRLAAPPPALDLDDGYEALVAGGLSEGAPKPLAGRRHLVPALHLGDDRPAQGRDLHLQDGARELRQYRHRDRHRLDRHDPNFLPLSTPPESISTPFRPCSRAAKC